MARRGVRAGTVWRLLAVAGPLGVVTAWLVSLAARPVPAGPFDALDAAARDGVETLVLGNSALRLTLRGDDLGLPGPVLIEAPDEAGLAEWAAIVAHARSRWSPPPSRVVIGAPVDWLLDDGLGSTAARARLADRRRADGEGGAAVEGWQARREDLRDALLRWPRRLVLPGARTHRALDAVFAWDGLAPDLGPATLPVTVEAARRPGPGDAALGTLLGEWTAAGLDVTVVVLPRRPGDGVDASHAHAALRDRLDDHRAVDVVVVDALRSAPSAWIDALHPQEALALALRAALRPALAAGGRRSVGLDAGLSLWPPEDGVEVSPRPAGGGPLPLAPGRPVTVRMPRAAPDTPGRRSGRDVAPSGVRADHDLVCAVVEGAADAWVLEQETPAGPVPLPADPHGAHRLLPVGGDAVTLRLRALGGASEGVVRALSAHAPVADAGLPVRPPCVPPPLEVP